MFLYDCNSQNFNNDLGMELICEVINKFELIPCLTMRLLKA